MGIGSSVDAFVFDFGGVLIDWDPRHLYRKLFADADEMERFLREIDFTAWNVEQDRGRPFREAVADLSARFPRYAGLIAAFHHRWEESIAGAVPGTADIVRDLRTSGYSLYGLSNWSAETFELVRGKYGVFELFDAIVLSGQVRACKPEPAIFEALLDRIPHGASRCLFVDDSDANVTAARALGFQAIRFTSAPDLRRALVERGVLA